MQRRNIADQAITRMVFGLLLITVIGCDQSSTAPEPIVMEELPLLDTSPDGLVSNGFTQIEILEHGALLRGTWAGSSPEIDKLFGLITGGVWIASVGTPTRATASGMFPRSIADLEFWNPHPDSAHFFLIEDDVEEERYSNWPTWLGAPSHENGSLKRYGFSMAWAAFKPKTDGSNASPLEEIRVGVTAFVSNVVEFTDAIFLRYDLTNVSESEALEIMVAHFSDLDVQLSGTKQDACGLDHNKNYSAFDSANELAFVYLSPDQSDGDLDPSCYGFAVGIGFLDLSEGGVPTGVFANRIATRFGGQSYYSRFATDEIYTTTDVKNALLGLDVDGSPMTDPSTGQVTKFAFTGDPITGTGWLDERNDPRQLMSKPSFILEAGSTKSMVLVVLKGEGSNYAEAILNLKDKFDQVRQTPSLWDK